MRGFFIFRDRRLFFSCRRIPPTFFEFTRELIWVCVTKTTRNFLDSQRVTPQFKCQVLPVFGKPHLWVLPYLFDKMPLQCARGDTA